MPWLSHTNYLLIYLRHLNINYNFSCFQNFTYYIFGVHLFSPKILIISLLDYLSPKIPKLLL